MSLVQEGIWLSQVAHGSVPLFNIGGFLKINGPIEPDIFIEAYRQAVLQNDAFRITLHRSGTIPGVVFSNTADELAFLDYSKVENPDQKAMAWWEKNFRKPFELYDRLMSRYYLLKVSSTLYYCLVCRHHLTMDGYSFSLLGRCLAENYNALIGGGNEFEAKPSYIDFIISDEEYRHSVEYEQAKAYWKNKYATLPPPIIPRRYASRFNTVATPSSFSYIWLERDFYNTLTRFTKNRQANVFFLMVAVLYTYFSRISDAREFVFSLPLLNRPTRSFMKTLGPFVNVIPVRISFGLDIDIGTFFELIKKELTESRPFHRFPLSEINRISGIQKSGRGQIFDIGLSYERFSYDAHFDGTPFDVCTMHNGYDQTPLTLAIKEYQKDQDVKLEFYYNLRAYKPDEIYYLMQRVKHLLEKIIETPGMALGRLPLIPDEELKKLLLEFNRKPDGPDAHSIEPIEERLASAARQYCEKTALLFGTQKMTYSMLHDRAARVGSFLKAILKGPEPFVGIYMHRSVEMVVAVLSVLKAGAVYIPLDPSYPEDRISFMLKDSGASVILTQKELVPNLSADQGRRVVAMDDFPYEAVEPLPHATQVPRDNLAYIIYTSGTTGRPKGVMCSRRGMSNLVAAQIRIFGIDASSRILQFASLSFDASVSEIFTALSAGATLVMAERNALMPGSPLLDTLERQKITHVTLPPSALAVMEARALPDLETLVTAGEACPSRLYRKWGKGRRFINAYGPTEASVCASAWICSQESGEHLPIGKPIDNTSLYVLNEDLEPVPIGEPGQLYIAGAGLARGYLNRPDLDRKKFIENPFSDLEGHERLYRTGDVVRFIPDSTLEFVGREDSQVKVRGYRIELQEIISVLTQHPGVLEAAVIVKETPLGDKYLVAFFSSIGHSVDDGLPAELKQYVRQKLPGYMIPSHFVHQNSLPHTPNGKIDGNVLGSLKIEAQSITTGRRQPVTELQRALITLLCSIMDSGSQSIGINDDLFDTGMDSLTAIRFLSAVEKVFGRRIPFSELVNNSTVYDLAELISIRGGEEAAGESVLVPIRTNGAVPPFFCITAGYGDLVKLRKLSDYLGRDQPFFMLQPPDTNGVQISARELSFRYAEEIRRQFPTGPYRIGGYSAGGLLAYATARQLSDCGSKVELLAMIGAPRRYSRPFRFINNKIGAFIARFLPDYGRISSDMLKILFALFKDRGLQCHLSSLRGYYPSGYTGMIDYFQGKRALSRFLGTHRTWMKTAEGEFKLHMVAGNHDSFMKEPYVADLAKILRQRLHAPEKESGVS